MHYEANLKDTDRVVAYGVRGMRSRPFIKRFPTLVAFARWCETEAAGDYTVESVEHDHP